MAAKDAEVAKNDDQNDGENLDISQAAIKKMISEARARGYITYDDLNKALPPDQVSSEQIEDVMSMLSEMGINIIEDEDADEAFFPGLFDSIFEDAHPILFYPRCSSK